MCLCDKMTEQSVCVKKLTTIPFGKKEFRFGLCEGTTMLIQILDKSTQVTIIYNLDIEFDSLINKRTYLS